ncbi:MAG: tRNA (adenosine(37)-N6)-threonylcarbamoyltransferase complex ATPase subunit type 1 TsaE [Patescibacteria group bacterium]|nr:tRNA (adenosine(37)-N6)-threonylcarbamoyltransferase complex ATPase subunit type 1 TsaE [Patescibacteria group bacterium]
MKNIITNTIEETAQLAKEFVQTEINGNMIICLHGELGAGKTTFTQGILDAFDAKKPYTSPTFVIMKEYDVDKKTIKKIYHIDAYRICGDDMLALGWEDIIADEQALIIIEWPENIADVLPQNTFVVLCEVVDENSRKYSFSAKDESSLN